MRPLVLAALAAVSLAGCGSTHTENPDIIWGIVHNKCVPSAEAGTGPGECAKVDLAGHGAVLKDRDGAYQYLLIPTDRVTGIEDTQVLAPNAPNWFAEAWDARGFFEQTVGHDVPRDAISLAINSVHARSQNQLHIHIDCLTPAVRDALRANPPSANWEIYPAKLSGDTYYARRLEGADLRDNPFPLVADAITGARAAMGDQTFAVVGATYPTGPGFALLAQAPGGSGHAEALQDQACKILGK